MRFMMIVKCNADSEAGRPPDPRLMEALGKQAEESIKAGILLTNGALLPTSKGARIRASGGKLSVIDGPFVEAKEVIGGYSIMEFRDKEEAMASAVEFMQLHMDLMPGWEGTCEVRAFAGFAGT